MSAGDPGEVPLHGGTTHRGQVVRVGDTVRRPLRPTSAATARLLGHLAEVGFDGAPRHLGVDERGREVLSYVPGEAVTPPFPAWALGDDALASVGRLLRRYHEAVADLDTSGQPWPRPVPDRYRGSLVSHNDPNLDNVVFRDGQAVALIDFDLAGPGSVLWDLAGAARLWLPLRPDEDVDDARRGRRHARLRVLLAAYGTVEVDPAALLDAVLAHHDWSYDIVGEAAHGGHEAFSGYLADGARERADRVRRWYLRHDAVREALGWAG